MKILKKGNYFVAYRDKHDVNTPDGVGMNDQIKIGDSLGKINIKTEKFVGNTIAYIPLSNQLDAYLKNDPTRKMIDKRDWYARVNITIPILKRIKEAGFVLDMGALTILSDKRNLILDTTTTEFKNRQKKGSTFTIESRLEIDFDTFPIDEENNYCVRVADILSKNFTGSLFLSDQDMDEDDGEFDFDNATATVTFYDLCGEIITKEIELEQ